MTVRRRVGFPASWFGPSIPTTKATRPCEPELSLPQITALGASVGGGWYVTGTHGDQPHRGNLLAPNHVSALGTSAETYVSQINLSLGSNIKDVRDNFESS